MVASAPVWERLGDTVADRWRAAQYDTSAFAAIAAEALEGARGVDRWSSAELADQLARWRQLPIQGPSSFANCEYTVYRHPRFRVVLNFWLHRTTTIHDHGFHGAFRVLSAGGPQSVQVSYTFDAHRRYSERFAVGELTTSEVRCLERGDVVRIAPAGFFHRLVHLGSPSVTLVVRTDRDAALQHDAYPPHAILAAGAWTGDHTDQTRIEMLQLGWVTAPGAALARVAELARVEPAEWTFRALLSLWPLVTALDPDGLAPALEAAREAHGAEVDRWRACLDQALWLEDANQRRALAASDEEKRTVALLSCAEDRRQLLELVAECFDADPVDALMSAVRDAMIVEDRSVELFDIAVSADDGHARALGDRLPAALEQVIAAALGGEPRDRLVSRLASEHAGLDEVAAAALLDQWAPLEQSLLRAVFRGRPRYW